MKKLALLITDIFLLYCALALVLVVRYGTSGWISQYQVHAAPFSFLFLVWIFSLYISNCYEERVLRNSHDFYERLAQAIGIASGLSIIFFYLIPYFGIAPRVNLFLFIAIFAALSFGARYLFNAIIATGFKKRLLIVGVNDESLGLAQFVANNPQFGYSVSAFVALDKPGAPQKAQQIQWNVIERLDDIGHYIHTKHIHSVILSPQAYGRSDLVGILAGALASKVNFSSLSSFTEQLTGAVPLGTISQQWFLDNIAGGSKRQYEVAKRIVDVSAAILLGIPTLALTPLIVLAIWINSPGYPFIHQRRTGRGGKQFTIIKFRSMIPNAERATGAVWAGRDDPRITKVGRVLRKTRLDELPQLWNILRGDMSLVGPRAERPEFDAKLSAQIPFYPERYLITPGLSGWAQINYRYGASTEDATRKLEYDLYYLKHRSLMLDIEILLKTISISLRRAGR